MGRQKEVQEEKWLLIQIVMKDDVEESGAKKKRLAKLSLFHPVSSSPQVLHRTVHKHNLEEKEVKRKYQWEAFWKWILTQPSSIAIKILWCRSPNMGFSVRSCGGAHSLNPYQHNASNLFPSICPQ